MEKVLLRKLSLKSVIKGLSGGYLENQEVSIILSQNPKLLARIYYLFEKVSFTDDILKQLNIVGEFEIKKPGTDKQKLINWYRAREPKINEMTNNQRLGTLKHVRSIKKKKSLINIISQERISPNKLRLKNQGH